MDEALRSAVESAVGSGVASARPVAGGDIAEAWCVRLARGESVFVKSMRGMPGGMAICEAEGLRWLAAADALRIPEVLAVRDETASEPGLLVLEWIEPGRPTDDTDVLLSRGLARLHRAGAESFGGPRDGFIGRLPQSNAQRTTWAEFYGEQRLAVQLRRARDEGRIGSDLARRATALIGKLDALVGPAEPPARLHGDLWSGNCIVDANGAPWLVDPAAYGGHREVDLAMMRLFGGFGSRCFAAYDEVYPLADGHETRVELYQLYPLLVHVNLFGGGYVGSFERALSRYA